MFGLFQTGNKSLKYLYLFMFRLNSDELIFSIIVDHTSQILVSVIEDTDFVDDCYTIRLLKRKWMVYEIDKNV
jgi:hypothetical protein